MMHPVIISPLDKPSILIRSMSRWEGQWRRIDRDMAVPSTGDPDRDFAAMMIPHHQGAVDMARIQLQFGKDPVLRRLAQGIIVEQLHEIDVMRSRLTVLPQAPGRPMAH